MKNLTDKVIVVNKGDAKVKNGQSVVKRTLREINADLKKKSKKGAEFRDALQATSDPILLGITQASLTTESWISAASFQETTKVLTDAAIEGKMDYLLGLKENVIMGHLIPAGTGQKKFKDIVGVCTRTCCFGWCRGNFRRDQCIRSRNKENQAESESSRIVFQY